MKKIAMAIFSLLLLGGCGMNQPEAEAIQKIEQAIEKNQTLTSASYETAVITQRGEEKQEVETVGTFIKKEDGSFDWNHLTYFGGDHSSATEILERDGVQFERVTISDPAFVPEWTELPEPTHDLMSRIDPLFEIRLAADDIEEIEQEGQTYQLILKESYIEEIRAEEVAFYQAQIDQLVASGAEDFVVQAYERQLALIEERTYSDITVTYTLDEAGFLIAYQQSYTVTEQEAGTYTEIYTYQLTDYNMENAESLLPTIE